VSLNNLFIVQSKLEKFIERINLIHHIGDKINVVYITKHYYDYDYDY
jgi:hypothetical protein